MTYTKNIMIWALVVLNVFFLAVFGLGLYRENTEKKLMYRELYELMQRHDVLLDTSGISDDGELYRLDTSRDPAAERLLAETLLGETTDADQSGSIIATYAGDQGEAVFRSGGEFQITFSQSVYPAGDSVESAVVKLLKLMAFETANVAVSTEDGRTTATAVCTWSDYRIFNCRVQFVYEDQILKEISGRQVANIRRTDEQTEMSASSAATALMRFLHMVKNNTAISCSAIMDVSPGYSFTAAVYGDGSLRPVWRITADSGVFYVDAETGEVEPSMA